MTIVTPFNVFPCISWWMQVMQADTLIFDKAEHFQKMTGRNRYDIAGANNRVRLSVPLVNGRNQHVPMAEVRIFNDTDWQKQHWRTLVSAYRRSPYFEHYEQSLGTLFETEFTHLTDFSMASINWTQQQLKLRFNTTTADTYIKDYPAGITDLRNSKTTAAELPKYYQVFEDRIGFLPDLSILDLLFSEGPFAVQKLSV
jgi:hypothetical protein